MYGWAETQAQRSMARSASRNEKSGHRGRRYSWEVAYVGTAAPAVRSSEARQRPGAAPENSPAFQRQQAILKGTYTTRGSITLQASSRSTASRVSTKRSASASEKISGGRSLSTL